MRRLTPWLYIAVVVACAAFIVSTSGDLPERVASHFGRDGQANGWMPREMYVRFILGAAVLVPLILVALLWIFRLVLEHSKWNKLSKMQNELYGKLLEKCSTNEELLASFRGSTGKPFFDLAAIEPPTSNPLARVFLLLQFGIVLTLAGGISLGFLYARAGDPRAGDARFLLGLGTLVFALGIGLIISAVVSYLLARHLGLLPQRDKAKETGASENTTGG